MLRVRERKTLMNNWLKRGALALVLGAFCTLSGAASAEPKPGILTPPTKGGAPAAAKGGNDKAAEATADKGKPDDKGKPGATPEAAGSAAASAAASAGVAPGGPEDEKAKEAAAAKRKEWKEARKAKAKDHRAEIKKKVEAALKGKPMVAAMKEELQRHARRLARLDRAKSVADEAKDADTVGRVDKLIAKENARHDKWIAGYDAKAAGDTKAASDKGGAK
jgi:hypothetical protein